MVSYPAKVNRQDNHHQSRGQDHGTASRDDLPQIDVVHYHRGFHDGLREKVHDWFLPARSSPCQNWGWGYGEFSWRSTCNRSARRSTRTSSSLVRSCQILLSSVVAAYCSAKARCFSTQTRCSSHHATPIATTSVSSTSSRIVKRNMGMRTR